MSSYLRVGPHKYTNGITLATSDHISSPIPRPPKLKFAVANQTPLPLAYFPTGSFLLEETPAARSGFHLAAVAQTRRRCAAVERRPDATRCAGAHRRCTDIPRRPRARAAMESGRACQWQLADARDAGRPGCGRAAAALAPGPHRGSYPGELPFSSTRSGKLWSKETQYKTARQVSEEAGLDSTDGGSFRLRHAFIYESCGAGRTSIR